MTLLLMVLVIVHVFAAALLLGGSFFIWVVVVPASRDFGVGEAERTRMIGQVARRFGLVVYASLAVLIGTGIPIAVIEFGTLAALVETASGLLLLVKVILVAAFLVLMYLHNVVYGRQITALAKAGQTEELRRLRRRSRPIAYINLALLTAIFLLGGLLHLS